MSSDPSKTGLWPTLVLRDPDAMLGWLTAIGFVENAVYRDEGVLVHGELLWPAGGGVMLGAERDNPRWPAQAGRAATYLVTDDVDAVFEAATRAGADTVQRPEDGDQGRSAAVADPEGNLWSFGSYAPSARPAAQASDPGSPAPSTPPSTPQAD
jgi:uncharacterized glyoxalase superfamily protein PhnB